MANPNNITPVQDREEANLASNNTSEESVEKPQPTRKSTGLSKATNKRRRPTFSSSSSGSSEESSENDESKSDSGDSSSTSSRSESNHKRHNKSANSSIPSTGASTRGQ